MSQERRTQARYGAVFDVRFNRARDAAKAFQTWSVNFSSGGLCVRSQSTFEVGEAVGLKLAIEGHQFELEAVVAWVRGEAVGLRFVNLQGEARSQLEGVAHLLAKKGPPVT